MPAAPRPLAVKVDAIRHRYPDARSLTLPALRFAQEEYGWLPPEALREVADVLDLTPAYCQAVASFYDMFHLEPVGRHMVEVCTNLSCALVGAQRVVEAFEGALRIEATVGDAGRQQHRRGDRRHRLFGKASRVCGGWILVQAVDRAARLPGGERHDNPRQP